MNILILLIGSNPLPNYIVGKYLTQKGRSEADVLPEPDHVILVHSDDTEKFAKRIGDDLAVTIHYVNLKTEERNPSVIVKMIQDKLTEIAKPHEISSVHLNYTGGTKPMSLYAQIAIAEINKQDAFKIILSDIDPNNHKIVLRNKPDYPLSGDLLDHVKVSIEKVLELHYMKTVTPGVQMTTIPSNDLMEFSCCAIDNYKKNQKDILKTFEKLKIFGRSCKDRERNINRNMSQSDFDNAFNRITTQFPSLTNFFNHIQGNPCPKLTFIEFFKGKWLEDFVLNCLTNLKITQNVLLDEIRKGVEASHGNRKTELDVIAIRGYKLFLFSCTTSPEIPFVKQKAFEAIYRAEQLGGEHAKAIVVSLMYNTYDAKNQFTGDHNLEELKKDLMQFDAARNCRVIGIDELHSECQGKGGLTQKLKNIILGVE